MSMHDHVNAVDTNSAILHGIPTYLIAKIRKVQNAAAKLITAKEKNDDVTLLLRKLHWLPAH